MGSLLNYFGVTRNDLDPGLRFPEHRERKQSIPLLFCSLDGDKGAGEKHEDVIFDLGVRQSGCNFNTEVKVEKNPSSYNLRSSSGFVAGVTKSVEKKKKPLTHILDEWCWIPINWGDGHDHAGKKMYHNPNKFYNIIQLAETGRLASGCKVMIPTHCNALEVIFRDLGVDGKKVVDRMHEAFFDVEILFSDSVTMENNPLWDFVVNIDNGDPLWHDVTRNEKEANIIGGIKQISKHYRDFCSRYGPWVISTDGGVGGGGGGGGHKRAATWGDDMWETMDKYCVGKPFVGLKELHRVSSSTGGMHPVMIQFTYVPKVERDEREQARECALTLLTLCTKCQESA